VKHKIFLTLPPTIKSPYMRRILLAFTLFLIGLSCFCITPDEGMWIPLLIEKYNIKLMKEKGFKLSAEDIYSVNRACMKDAVVSFEGVGCTAEFISGEGLLITNHHCGYEIIQEHSSLEHDYLTRGFWAMSKQEELPNPGLKVTLLKWMEDVTDKVLSGTNDGMGTEERGNIIYSNIKAIQAKTMEGTNYEAVVRSFYMGNQYFLFVNEVFRDIRLVGAPPSSIGKFGGDTDNWTWPRHTGDFSLFRVYTDRNNNPAEYSPDNTPYKPGFYFPVSIKGIREGDFTMVIGYPGSTSEYISSYQIDMIKNYIDPKMIALRTKKIEIIDEAMESDPLIRIQYSAKKADISNSWKKWMGEIQGLEKMNTIEKEKEFENRLTDWIESDSLRKSNYGDIIPSYGELFPEFREFMLVNSFTNEVMNGIESVALAGRLKGLADLVENNGPANEIQKIKESLIESSLSFFKDYNQKTDQKLFVALLEMYGETLDTKWLTPSFVKMKKSCNGDFNLIAGKLYKQSVITQESEYKAFVTGFSKASLKSLKNDPFYILSTDYSDIISKKVRPGLTRLNSELRRLNRIYMKAQMVYNEDKILYPDANSTLRIAFGQIMGYYPRDAVYFKPVTKLKGIIEKDNPEIYDYDVPAKLKELYNSNDFGRYGQGGELNVCFIANNHTTGGNSGSPVINAEGHLIGVNFDRAWEGVASDMAYNPDQSRNISLDIRYALFIIDKFAGAGYLLNEMTIIE
jgi:hypothetical protein